MSLGMTVLWRFVSLELLRRTETLSFSVVYAVVFLIPALLPGLLSLLSVFMRCNRIFVALRARSRGNRSRHDGILRKRIVLALVRFHP